MCGSFGLRFAEPERTFYAALWPSGMPRAGNLYTRLDLLSRPLELDCVPAALGDNGDDAAVGAIELRPRLHPVDADALPCSERLPSC